MLELSLQDCSLTGKNIFVKEYEKDCLYDLYPEYGKSIETVNVHGYMITITPIVRNYRSRPLVEEKVPRCRLFHGCWRGCVYGYIG